MESIKLSQVELPLHPAMQEIDLQLIIKQKTMTDAIKLSINVSNYYANNIHKELEIDAGHWTRILKGDAYFPQDKLIQLSEIVGNEVPLVWWAHKCGYELHRIKSDVELENDAVRAENTELRKELEVVTKFMRGINT